MTPTILALLLAAGLPVPPQASQLPPWYHWLYETFRPAGGGSGTILTVTGVSPLALVNALSAPIHSLTQYGKCVQNGTPTPSAPVDILCNNGELKYSANMADVNEQTARVGYYINAQGAVLADVYNWFYQDFIPVKPNTQYTLSMSTPVYYVTISEYSTAEDSGFVVRKNGSTGSNTSLTIITGDNTNFIRFGANLNRVSVTLDRVLAIDWMLNIGTAMDYQPYIEGGIYTDGEDEVLTVSAIGAETQTVTDIPMLLGVGDYKDEAELISGIKTGKIGIKVLDGTENWTAYQTSSVVAVLQNATSAWGAVAGAGGYCTHLTVLRAGETTYAGSCRFATDFNIYEYKTAFGVENLAGLKAKLAAQYAAGTPVILVYPLATETTEQTTPHALHSYNGTTVVSVTSPVDPVELRAEYKGVVT